MAFEPIEKTPGVSPLLVRLYDTHNLYSLAENKGSGQACFELTTVMVDLLNIQLSPKESELITDVLLTLMKQAETDLKIALSERLSAMEKVPLRMILSLANDEICVADPVLRRSPLLQDMDLVYILKAQGAEHGRAIATREALSDALIDLLADFRDIVIANNLATNDKITMTRHAFDVIADMAQAHHDLAQPLLSRKDLPKEIADKLYRFVSDELQERLRARFGKEAEAPIIDLEDITLEIIHPERVIPETAYAQLIANAERMRRRGDLKINTILSTLRRGQHATFLAQLTVYTNLHIEVVKKLLQRESGLGLAMICKANDIPKNDFVSLFLLTERFRTNTKRIINHAELTRIMAMYDKTSLDAAKSGIRNAYN